MACPNGISDCPGPNQPNSCFQCKGGRFVNAVPSNAYSGRTTVSNKNCAQCTAVGVINLINGRSDYDTSLVADIPVSLATGGSIPKQATLITSWVEKLTKRKGAACCALDQERKYTEVLQWMLAF